MVPILFLIFIAKPLHPHFSYLTVSQWASHVPHNNTVRQVPISASKLEHRNRPRFQSVHHLPRLGFFPGNVLLCLHHATNIRRQLAQGFGKDCSSASTWNSSRMPLCFFQLDNHFFFSWWNMSDRGTKRSHQLSSLGNNSHHVLAMKQQKQG